MTNGNTLGEKPVNVNPERQGHPGLFIVVFVILGALVVGEIYSLSRLGSIESNVLSRQAQMASQMDRDLSAKVQAMEQANAQSFQRIQDALNQSEAKMGVTAKQAVAHARYASYLARKFAKQDEMKASMLQQELALKANQDQMDSMNHDIASAKYKTAQNKTGLNTLANDLGMARSSMGTLIATNQRDIKALRKLGLRDYYTFDLQKNQKRTVAGVELVLKKANEGHYTYNIVTGFNDMNVYRKNLAIDSPFFFAPQYTHQFYELVVYQIGHNWVKGYISTPKGSLHQKEEASTGGGSPVATAN